MAIITLTTDFGTADGYVGAMKGVIARLAGSPAPAVVDLAHDIPPGDIAHAAWVIATSTTEFPHGSIHVVVVDPGVGGTRREVVVRARGRWYVGPDNGVFAYVAEPSSEAYAIENERFRAERVSRTFHGRDVFASTAAAIASGEDPATAGRSVQLAGELPWGPREPATGRIVHIDRFGNLISDFPEAEAGRSVAIAGTVLPLLATYENVPPGELLAYIGSAGTVEIAVRDGRADRRLGLARGALVLPVPSESVGQGPYR
ncbi:MAG: SAM-dependent chlorinase/fluorinase [Deltaproteobacteria bacterium]|nr:MAG: SAM-dependent chlorinase/fluorinase [Deltaproteobacteria bacterium]